MARRHRIALGLGLLAVLAAAWFVTRPGPTTSSDRILVDKFPSFAEPKPGDVVVFRDATGRRFIKRVIAREGEKFRLGPEER